jgi:aminopeptidase-like protein
MANNELSGPVLSAALAKYVKSNFKKKKYSYRFLFIPETIGSIAYISKNLKNLKKNVKAGFVLTCVGDERAYSHIESRYGNTLADQALEAAFIGKKRAKKYSYLARGSDERQFCYPGVDLPVACFCKSKFGNFPEYHTSDDNFDLVTSKGLNDSFNLMKTIIDTLEYDKKFSNVMTCEAQLVTRGLYPSLSHKHSKDIYTRLDVMCYADGTNNIFEISKIINVSLEKTLQEIKILKNAELIK